MDYALPRGRLARLLVYRFVSLYEGEYYAGFVKSDLATLLREAGVEPEKELSVLLGAARIATGQRR